MEIKEIIKADIEAQERKRVADIKSLSYLERLERLMILIEVSYTLRKANRISIQKGGKFSNNV